MAAPAFGSIGTLFGSSTSTPAFAVPASVASGDIIVVAFYCQTATTTITGFPAGFAEAENSPRTVNSAGSPSHALHVAWKRASGADSGTYSFTLSAAVFTYGNAVRYTGCVAAGNPWDTPTAAGDGGSTSSTTTPDIAVTTAGPDRLLFFVGTNENGDGGTWTAPSGFSERQGGASVTNCEISDKVQAAQGGSGNTHATSTSSNIVGDWLGALIGTTVSGSIPYNPQRSTPQRDPGEVWWIQRDRRDANTVATAANPLPSPLDSAWQASARYWHLYGDAADAAPRTWQSLQRNYISDPSLLAPAGTDPLGMPTGPAGDIAAYWDRREVPQQRAYVSDPLLLGTALLENELLGSADTARHAQAAAFVDRREVPQQRPYVSDPLLLTTAELENELLGGADTAKRANVPATHASRWWMPQQPLRDGQSPGLLDDGLLENELLGGADDRRRRALLAATHVDRREVPQQPPRWTVYFDAGPDVPPLTLSWGAGGRYWALYNQAGWQPDRREVPQQRAYVSDPSFYPLVPPTDPLTLAFGAGGTYWLLYNTAALQVDRREVPQQRRYVSDPGLLATALLENELLGGADLLRRYLAAAYSDRRETATQPPRFDPNSLVPDAEPLAIAAGVGGDLWRRANTPAYADRRQGPEQPARWTVYFDAGPSTPPLTLSWGAGGNLWHLYNRAADLVDRTWRPQQRAYVSDPLFYFVAPPVNANSTALVGTVYTSTGTVTATVTSVTSVSAHATSTPTVSDG